MAQQLRMMGFDAFALLGGYDAWRANHPVELKPMVKANAKMAKVAK